MSLSQKSRKPSPIRIPSRQPAIRQPTTSALTAEQIDIFEHAALLYHGYEWQAAADAFNILSRSIASPDERIMCLLNVGLIQARLGNRERAAGAFEEAAMISPPFLLTHFLVALVSCENGDYAKAEAHIETCIDGLDQDQVDYGPMGLNFTLDRALLIRALRDIRSAQFRAGLLDGSGRTAIQIASIPAECIFEAPPRSGDVVKIAGTGPKRKSRLRMTLKTEKISEWMNRLGSGEGEGRKMPSSPYWLHDPMSPSSPLDIYYQGLLEIAEDSATSPDPPPVSTSTDGFRFASPTSPGPGKRRTTWHQRPSTPFTPRDARAESESVRELARFIRESRQKKPTSIRVPKDARGEYESVKELARFVQFYAPERSDSVVLQPFDLDPRLIADLRMERILNRTGEPAVSRPTAETMLNEDNRSTDASLGRQGVEVSPGRYSAPYGFRSEKIGHDKTDSLLKAYLSPLLPDPYSLHSASGSPKPTLEVLQPAVYKPQAADRGNVQSGSVQSSSSNRHTEGHEGTTPSTPPSSASSFYRGATSFDRRMMARQDALLALEGKPNAPILKASTNTKSLPPTPPSGDTASSIATVDFFDKVLGKKAKI